MSILDHFRSAQTKNDFAVEITDRDWTPEWSSLISKQTKSVKVNFARRTLVFHLRQLKIGVVQDVIFHILDSAKDHHRIDKIVVTPAKKAPKDAYQYHFLDGEVIDHECEFSYDDTGELIHVLTVQFDRVVLKTPPGARRTEVTIKAPEKDEKQQLNG